MDDLFSLEGKTALVTGGGRGIGRMIADGFMRAGATTIISSRNAEVCDEAAAELSKFGRCIAIPADLARHDECVRLAGAAHAAVGPLDILVNNAGTTWGAPVDDFPSTAWDKVLDVNLKGVFYLTQALLGPLREGATSASSISARWTESTRRAGSRGPRRPTRIRRARRRCTI
jgi:NAD(P)-dependent dehydrogenase (short-subunit alcohol dehydrogenase family)